MSLSDFESLSMDEFDAVCKAYGDEREALIENDWERTRAGSCIGIQPHIKGRADPKRILPLPWDKRHVRRVRTDDDPVDDPTTHTQAERARLMRLAHGKHD